MGIQRLPVFLSAAENLNFTKAAEEQCISQTTSPRATSPVRS